jgi:hypothetical protein
MFFFQCYVIGQLCCWSVVYIIWTMHNIACLYDLTFGELKICQPLLLFYFNKVNLPNNCIQYIAHSVAGVLTIDVFLF